MLPFVGSFIAVFAKNRGSLQDLPPVSLCRRPFDKIENFMLTFSEFCLRHVSDIRSVGGGEDDGLKTNLSHVSYIPSVYIRWNVDFTVEGVPQSA